MKTLSPFADDEKIPQHFRVVFDRVIKIALERKYCAVLGPRFSGKTDLLNLVREELEHRSRVVVQVNLYDADATKPSDFFNNLAKIICQQLANQSRNSKTFAVSVSDSSTFRSFIQDVIDQLNEELVLIVDHLEGVPIDLVRSLLTSLRAIYMEQNDNSGHRLIAIVAGALSLAGIATGETSPFRGIAELVIVDLPPDEESERYIKTFFSKLDVRLSSATLKQFIRAARGDRYLIEILCDKCAQLISEKNPKKLSVPLVEKISQEFILNEAQSHAPLQEAVRLIENDPDLLICTLLLTKKSKVNRQQLPLSLSPDIDPFYLTGVVRKVGPDSYQFRNEIYQQFLTRYFHPNRVGHILSMSGRWDQAIDYLEASILEGNNQYQSDLLDATINAMYAADDVNLAAHYLMRGLLGVFNVENVQVLHFRPKKNILKSIAQVGKEAKFLSVVEDEILISSDRLEARVYREMYPLHEQENGESDKFAVPLVVSGYKPIGVVSMYDFLADTGSTKQREWELRLISYLNQAARAIHDVDSRREGEQRREELAEILREVTVLINGSLDLHEVLRLILKQMNRVLPFDMASVQLVNTARNALEIIASQGFEDPKSVEELSFSLDDTYPNSRVWHKKLPIRYANVREYFPHFTDPKYHATRIRGWLGVPLLIGESAIGVITLDSFTPNSYTLEHEHLAMAFASQAAVAIKNARLFEQTRQHGEQLAVMDQIVLHIARRLETKELLRNIVRRATELIKGAGGGVYLWDETVQAFRLESVYGLNSSFEGRQIEKEQGVIWEVLRGKKPYAVTDYPNWSKRLSIFDQDDLTAVVGAPIILGDRFLGVIAVHDTVQGRVFGEPEKDLLYRFGNHVAVALENANLIEQLENENRLRMDESQALQNVGISLTGTIELNAVLNQVMQAALKLVEGDEGSILFFDDGRDEFLPDALMSTGIGQPLQSYRTKTRPTKGLAYKIIKEKTFVIISDTELDSRISKVSIEKGRRAMVGVPLISHEGPVGVLWVNWKNPRQLSDREANILTALASQATVAIQGAKRYADIQDYARLREGLLKAGQEIITLKQPEEVLKSIVANIKEALNCDLVTLYTYSQENGTINFPAYVQGELNIPEGIGMLGRVSRESVIGKILDRGEAYFADDSAHDSVMNFRGYDRPINLPSFIEREGIQSSAGIPLTVGDEKLGILFVNYRNPNPFTQEEREVIRLFSNIISIAIHNAKQFNVLHEAQDELLAAGTIAWMGLFGAEWSHTVAQKTFSIRNFAGAIKGSMSVESLEVMRMLESIDMIAREIQDVPLAISTPAQAEVGEPLLIDEFLQNETKLICKLHEDIRLDLLMGCKETVVRADRSLLRMALQKLIDNAIRNMPPNGNLLVESRHGDNGTIIIAIQDTGKGIPENIKNIYGHQHIPKEKGQPGSGMGAMLARFILKKNGGDLRLVWSEIDKGTRIEIVLPTHRNLTRENS